MLYQLSKIKMPPQNLIYEKHTKDNSRTWYEFPYRYRIQTNVPNEYIYLDYWFVTYSKPIPQEERYINIRGIKPQTNKSKDGRVFLTCYALVDLLTEEEKEKGVDLKHTMRNTSDRQNASSIPDNVPSNYGQYGKPQQQMPTSFPVGSQPSQSKQYFNQQPQQPQQYESEIEITDDMLPF